MRPFRFGVTLFPIMASRAGWLDSVRRVEASGFSVLTVTDHFHNSGGVWSSLVAAYDAAPSLRVGTLVLNNDFWNPSVLAREAITADVLTEGSLELGVGAGWDDPDYAATGIEKRSPGTRIERLGEALRILRPALSGEPVRFEGAHYRVDGGAPWPRPAQSRVPLLVGGGGRRVLRLAAREADIVSVHRNLEHGVAASWVKEKQGDRRLDAGVSERIGWIREAAGDRFAALELHALILKVAITDHRESAAAELGRANGLSADDVLASPHYLVGTVNGITDELRERRERWGISYWTLAGGQDPSLLAPVVERLSSPSR
jgi:probable F420-dependent oxidoreductase